MSKKTKQMGLERKRRQKERLQPLHKQQELQREFDRIVNARNHLWKKNRKDK